MLWNDPLTGALVKRLDMAALQQKVTAQNIANLNTPGYKRSYVEFNDELHKAKAKLPLKRTHPLHLTGKEQVDEPLVKVESCTSRRIDGNNVDLDQEMIDMVRNQLHYNTLVQTISERYDKWRFVINEGRR